MSSLPLNFRKLTIRQRRELISSLFNLSDTPDGLESPEILLSAADSMVENAAGIFPLPLGFIPEVLINGKKLAVPLATEEPSVIAAASYGALIAGRNGGVRAWGARSLMAEQIFLMNPRKDSMRIIDELKDEIFNRSRVILDSMVKRGGGLDHVETSLIDEHILKVELIVDVCDAMGANILNTLGESLGPWIAEKTDTDLLMSILSNSGEYRVSSAEIAVPALSLARGGQPGLEIAEKIIRASRIAELDPRRAVTHNKGIMNGVTALLLATGNDTRAAESAAHHYACRSGRYRGLSRFSLEKGLLTGRIEIPVPAAVVGGAVQFHPVAVRNLKILGVSSAAELSGIAAAVGLLQNFAALFALVSEGIQKGHMRLHARKGENH